MTRVALLGTGKMGAPIARRIAAAGHDLHLWNRSLDRARAVGAGAVHESPSQAAEGAEVVLTILTDAHAVREVYGKLEPTEGQVYVEMSTGGVDVVEDLARRFPHLLAAPIVGSVRAIEAGTASILAGGDAADYARAAPVLSSFGEQVHVPTRRQAVALKLVTNAMFGVCSAAAAELQSMGERAGLEAEAVFGLLERTMPYLKARKRGYVDHDHSAPLFFIKDMVKDLDLALGLAHRSAAAMPLLAVTRELYAEVARERPTDEITALIERY
jgi:3-hydroxyisobutyrate dehydrogenase-like beta-hydroxyacid dehydrogenase